MRQISDKRVAEGKFAVALLFWDEIVSSLLLNPAVLKAHYPQLHVANHDVIDRHRLVAALELGYYGADLWAYIELIYGEFGQMAQADPDELIAMLPVIERRVQQLLPPDDAAPILTALAEVRKGCLARKKAESDWHPVETHARRVSSRIHSAVSLISLTESKVLGDATGVPGTMNETFLFDAEYRINLAQANGSITYVYDGEGRRVQKSASTFTTNYVYDTFGKVIQETTTLATAAPFTGTEYLTQDHLGSVRLALNNQSTNNSNSQFEFYNYSTHPPAGSTLAPNLQELGNQYNNTSGANQVELYYNDFFGIGSPGGINVQTELYTANTGTSSEDAPAQQVSAAVQIAFQNYRAYLNNTTPLEVTGSDGTPVTSTSGCNISGDGGPYER